MLGILLVDKPSGITSHDAVNRVRRKLGTKRVGHAGTLDPLATGLLVIAVGPATRFLQYLPLEPKEYDAELTFGRETDTFDAEGKTTREARVPDDLRGAIADALQQFRGLIQQTPPMHSAVKVAGMPLYRYARQGIDVDRQTRTVHIQSVNVAGVSGATAAMKVVCSGGTYIRTLAHDIGEAIGCGAYLSALRRIRVGRFDLGRAIPLEDVSARSLVPLREALPPMPLVRISVEQVQAVREGQPVQIPEVAAGLIGLMEPAGEVFSVARVNGNRVQPECVIPSEALDG